MHCHVNPFMMNNFHCHCGYNYYNPFGATRRFMLQSAMNFNMIQQYYTMLPYQMAFNNNIFAQPYQMPVFQPVFQHVMQPQIFQMPAYQSVMPQQVSIPQLTMPPQQPSINYAEIFENNYNSITDGKGNINNNSFFNAASSLVDIGTSALSAPLGPIKDTGKLDKNVLNKVKQMAQNLNCDYKDILAVINNESGFQTRAGEKTGSQYVGLIQFGPAAREELKRIYGINVSREQILNMTPIQQLDLAEKIWKANKKAAFGDNARLSGPDLYALIFLPARANREVLCVKGERGKNGKLLGYYEQNPMDANNDGKLTKSDLQARLNKKRVNESIFA